VCHREVALDWIRCCADTLARAHGWRKNARRPRFDRWRFLRMAENKRYATRENHSRENQPQLRRESVLRRLGSRSERSPGEEKRGRDGKRKRTGERRTRACSRKRTADFSKLGSPSLFPPSIVCVDCTVYARTCVYLWCTCARTRKRASLRRAARSCVHARRERERERETGHRDSASKNSWLGYREKSLFL